MNLNGLCSILICRELSLPMRGYETAVDKTLDAEDTGYLSP